MHKVGDVDEVIQQLDRLFADQTELASRGKAARRYVKTFFAEEIVTDEMRNLYERRLTQLIKK